jgi:uncharacterized protein (TIGR02611 family)
MNSVESVVAITAPRKIVLRQNLTWLRRLIVAVVGFAVLLIGVAMVAPPGPAVLVIPLGLAILATEFVWARRLLKKARVC